MTIVDWRSLSAGAMAPLLGAEGERWRIGLDWHYSDTLDDIERARVGGQLRGVAALAGGRVAGWSYYLLHRGTLLIGGLQALSSGVVRQLMAAILRSDDAGLAGAIIAFGYFDAPGHERALTDCGFSVEPYLYLSRDLNAPLPAPAGTLADYDIGKTVAVAGLLKDAYAWSPPNRPFAIGDSDEEWVEYVTQLTMAQGCGVFDVSSSALHADGDAVAMVSAVSPATAHLCQLAVRPRAAGRGVGSDLLAAVSARAKDNGRARMTLTVASSNTAALALYRRCGFSETARFTFARR